MAQRGVYTVSFERQSFTNANGDYDFFEITPVDDRPLEIVALSIDGYSELGDAQEEQVAWTIVTDNATTGNGTATTPRPLDPRDGAAGFTAEVVGATVASTGTEIQVVAGCFNIRAGLLHVFPEIMRPKVDQADVMLGVRMEAGLADDATISGTVWVREL